MKKCLATVIYILLAQTAYCQLKEFLKGSWIEENSSFEFIIDGQGRFVKYNFLSADSVGLSTNPFESKRVAFETIDERKIIINNYLHYNVTSIDSSSMIWQFGNREIVLLREEEYFKRKSIPKASLPQVPADLFFYFFHSRHGPNGEKINGSNTSLLYKKEDIKIVIEFQVNKDNSISDVSIVESSDEKWNEPSIKKIQATAGYWQIPNEYEPKKIQVVFYKEGLNTINSRKKGDLHYEKAYSFFEKQKYEKALNSVNKAIEMRKEPYYLELKAKANEKLGKYKEACTDYRESVSLGLEEDVDFSFDVCPRTITIQVVDKKNKNPLEEVSINVNPGNLESITNSRGYAEFEVPPKSTITITKDGYQDLQFPTPKASSFRIEIMSE